MGPGTTARRIAPIIALALILTLALPAVTAADWLVTRDGERIETVGPWRAEGDRVVFTLPGGTLASLPSSEVDIEASDAATRGEGQGEGIEEEEAGRQPILVLTDGDVRAWIPKRCRRSPKPTR